MKAPDFTSVSEYIASQPPAARTVLKRVRSIIRKETYVLYHAARRRLGEEAQSALLGEFERIEAAALESESRETVLDAVQRIGARVAAAARPLAPHLCEPPRNQDAIPPS